MMTWTNKILMCLADMDITIVWLVDFSCVIVHCLVASLYVERNSDFADVDTTIAWASGFLIVCDSGLLNWTTCMLREIGSGV
jgi:hypothetical protein